MITLPTYDGRLENYQPKDEPLDVRAPSAALPRIAFAAAHVISDPLAERDPWQAPPAVDWEATLRFRHHLWDQGLGLAEAMDTAQRGMGVDWATAKELIHRTMFEAKAHPLSPRVACGAGTDHLPFDRLADTEAIIAAYETQMEHIEAAGGQIILMASRAFTAIGAGPDEYARAYDTLIENAAGPVILHWLGDMFDGALKGYWGAGDTGHASDIVLDLLSRHSDKVDGIKISLLDQAFEESFRARMPNGVRLYTGDDFNYPALIEGDGATYSDALLGIFAAIAPAASQALEALATKDTDTYHRLLEPTVPLAREIFKAPTQHYKAGIAFLSWLNGLQDHFVMPGGFQSSREITHFAHVYRLADQARLLLKPDIARARMKALLQLHGVL